MLGQREEIWDAVLVEHGGRQHDIGAEEDIAGEVAELSRRMAVKRNRLESNPCYLVVTWLDNRIDRAGFGEQEVPAQGVERIGTAEEGDRLQQGVAEERLVDYRCVDDGAGPLDDRGVATEVVRVGMRGEHRHDLAVQLLADGLQRLLGARLVEPGVDEHDLPLVIGEHTDVDSTGQDPDAIGQWYQHSQ